jgi:tetratricopeptide (TPR) repeat protein
MRSVYVVAAIAGFVPLSLCCQANAREQLEQAFSYQKQGQFNKVIAAVPALLLSGALTPLEEGQTWTVLGFAYAEEGDFYRAEDSYIRALRILNGNEEFSKDDAITLENFANLYREMGKLDDAFQLAAKALQVFQRLNSHDGIARSCASLASLDLARRKVRQSEPYLAMAVSQTVAAEGLDEDDYADISATQAWHAELTGDRKAAIAGYQHALELWRHKHGEEYMITGWGYVLLGQADLQAGKTQEAVDNIRGGLAILNRTVGSHNQKYLFGEIAYSRALESAGAKREAIQMRSKAERELASLRQTQCTGCRVNVAALR